MVTKYNELDIKTPHGWDKERPLTFTRKGQFAGHCADFTFAHEIELRENYNGSGKENFGGASKWPVIVCKVAFNEGECELASEFAHKLGEFVDDFLKSKGR